MIGNDEEHHPGQEGAETDPQAAIPTLGPQIADASAAFALVRQRAAEWRIDPDRIGMVGFSAGAMLTLATTLSAKDAKPAFIGLIYGPLSPVTVPADAPPMFVALAADDPFFANSGQGLIDSWRAATPGGGGIGASRASPGRDGIRAIRVPRRPLTPPRATRRLRRLRDPGETRTMSTSSPARFENAERRGRGPLLAPILRRPRGDARESRHSKR